MGGRRRGGPARRGRGSRSSGSAAAGGSGSGRATPGWYRTWWSPRPASPERLPAGLGLALNPDGAPGLPLYPESVSYLARLDQRGAATIGVGHPPTEPLALLTEARARLRRLRFVRSASRAWLSVPDRGEGLVIAVALDDPASEPAHRAVIGALLAAVASVPLHVPFPVDVAFPGEPTATASTAAATASGPDIIAEWMSRNTRPFYTRD